VTAGSIIETFAQLEDSASAGGALQNVLPPLLMVVGVVLLGFILVNSVRGRIARRQAETPSPRERIERMKAAAGGQEDIHAAGAELLKTAQRLAGQLDAKAERLEQLLAPAEQRIASLEALLRQVEALSAQPSSGAALIEPEVEGPAGTDEQPASAVPVDPLTAMIYELADAGRGPVQIAQQLDEQVGKVELILALRGDDR
jgi:hypothetical protein